MLIDSLPPKTKSFTYYAAEEIAEVDLTAVPRHLAIIPDGNRRWAKRRLSSATKGHMEGADILMNIVRAAQELGVKILTLYSFSTENWNRSAEEIHGLMLLLASYLHSQREEMTREGVRLRTIGDLSRLPDYVLKTLKETEEATRHCERIQLVLALNYGGRDEICRAFRAMLEDYTLNKLKKEDINEAVISQYLDTADWGDPELLIRAGGEMRLSNFLIWQSSYTEVYVSDVLWPDFTPRDLLDALINFQHRERRFLGGA